jgi:hypothetical protein
MLVLRSAYKITLQFQLETRIYLEICHFFLIAFLPESVQSCSNMSPGRQRTIKC